MYVAQLVACPAVQQQQQQQQQLVTVLLAYAGAQAAETHLRFMLQACSQLIRLQQVRALQPGQPRA